jgi:cytochrome c-type biogenesis protein CcsB
VTTAELAAFSNNAVMFASIVYVLAFVAHIAEWAVARPAAVVAPTAVSVGAANEPAETLAVPAEPPAEPPAELEPPVEPSSLPVGSRDRPDDRSERYGRIGVALTVVACAIHFLALVTRGLGADPARVPWGNMYEFTLAGTFGVTLIYLLLLRRYQLRWMGVLVTGFVVVVLMLDVLVLYVPAGPLVPALHSYWLVIHVAAAVMASGAFAVGALVSALYLVKLRAADRGAVRSGGYLDRLPALAVLDRVAYRVHAFAFPIWTFAALVAGPIWAEYAWGSYWNWDPKEVWAFVTWVIYAAYLHARATAGWKGKAAAIIALVGFASLLFNFVGINFFFGGGSMHSYAG